MITDRTRPMDWLAEHWPKATIFLAIYSLVFLFGYLYESNFLLFLIALQTPVYWLHQFEEYVYPGGFAEFFNRKLLNSTRADWPVTKAFSLWINIPLIFIAFPVSAILAGSLGLSWGLWTAYFSILNALSHVVMFFRFRYNPGFLVSLLLNIPIGIYTVSALSSAGVIDPINHIRGIGLAVLLQGALMVYGLGILRRRVQK